MNTRSRKYAVNQYHIEVVLGFILAGEIAISEIQRPFVWDATKVRDLMDSLYQGFPIGYLIAWKNPSVRLKDGTLSEGKKVLIDGQQRVTALTTAILGQPIVDQADGLYVGYCPDLFPWGGVCHASTEEGAYHQLCALVTEEVVDLLRGERQLPPPSTRPMREAVPA